MRKQPEKLVPSLRFKGFTDDWEQYKIYELFRCFSGGTPQVDNKEFYDGNIPFIRSGEINNSKTALNISSNGLENSSAKMVKIGDVLYALYGATSGDVAISKINGAINQAILALVPKSNMNSYNVVQVLKMNKEKIIQKYLQGGQGNLSGSIIKNLSLSLPKEISEQDKLKLFFSHIDNLIALYQRRLELNNKLRSVITHHLFYSGSKTPSLRFRGFTNTWEYKKLGSLGETFNGLSGKSKKDFGYGDAKYITYVNVFSNPFANLNEVDNIGIDKKQNEVRFGDIIFTTSSETRDEVGMSSVWLHNKPNVYLNSFCFGLRPSLEIDPLFIGYLLRTSNIRKSFTLLAQGISRFNISKIKAMDTVIMLPSLEEQKNIGLLLKYYDDRNKLFQKHIRHLEELKHEYLKKLFI